MSLRIIRTVFWGIVYQVGLIEYSVPNVSVLSWIDKFGDFLSCINYPLIQ